MANTYSFEVTEDLICEISKDGEVLDATGPWESEESATEWAEVMVEELNSGDRESISGATLEEDLPEEDPVEE
jgi:hypothetical protein